MHRILIVVVSIELDREGFNFPCAFLEGKALVKENVLTGNKIIKVAIFEYLLVSRVPIRFLLCVDKRASFSQRHIDKRRVLFVVKCTFEYVYV